MRNSSTSPTPSPHTLTQKYEDLERGGGNKKNYSHSGEKSICNCFTYKEKYWRTKTEETTGYVTHGTQRNQM